MPDWPEPENGKGGQPPSGWPIQGVISDDRIAGTNKAQLEITDGDIKSLCTGCAGKAKKEALKGILFGTTEAKLLAHGQVFNSGIVIFNTGVLIESSQDIAAGEIILIGALSDP